MTQHQTITAQSPLQARRTYQKTYPTTCTTGIRWFPPTYPASINGAYTQYLAGEALQLMKTGATQDIVDLGAVLTRKADKTNTPAPHSIYPEEHTTINPSTAQNILHSLTSETPNLTNWAIQRAFLASRKMGTPVWDIITRYQDSGIGAVDDPNWEPETSGEQFFTLELGRILPPKTQPLELHELYRYWVETHGGTDPWEHHGFTTPTPEKFVQAATTMVEARTHRTTIDTILNNSVKDPVPELTDHAWVNKALWWCHTQPHTDPYLTGFWRGRTLTWSLLFEAAVESRIPLYLPHLIMLYAHWFQVTPDTPAAEIVRIILFAAETHATITHNGGGEKSILGLLTSSIDPHQLLELPRAERETIMAPYWGTTNNP